jgi:hypothetical protein
MSNPEEGSTITEAVFPESFCLYMYKYLPVLVHTISTYVYRYT